MSTIEAIILGIIQGLTEFLPVSSSGHLELAKAMLGDKSVPNESMLMTVVLHGATALSTVVIFWKDIVQIFKGLFSFKNNAEFQFALKIVLSMIPAAIIGILFDEQIEKFFMGQIGLVGAMLLLTGVLLFLAEKAAKTEKDVSISNAIIVGIAQGIAILPGISRSGATIGTSVLLGIDREKAARFSFLMVIPLICGAMLVKGKKHMELSELDELNSKERTSLIVTELNKDGLLSQDEISRVGLAVQSKEDFFENDSYNDSIAKTYFFNDLKSAVDEKKAIAISEHDFARVRSKVKTSSTALAVGFLFAFLTGLVACKWMISLVKKSKLQYFAYYCFIVGTIAIIYACTAV